MESLLQNKKIVNSLTVFLIVVSLLSVAKIINEIKLLGQSQYATYSIQVEGKGEVTAVSDIATLYINLNKEAVTAKEAQNLLNESITKTLEYLETQKVEKKDIKSEYGGINPKYSSEQPVCYTYPCPIKDPKIVGYTATQSITVKVRETDNANVIRTGLADIGVTDISGPTFSIDDEDILKEQAKELAIKDAKEKAKVLAKNLGVRLGKIISYYDNSNGGYPMYDSMMMKEAGGMAPVSVSSAPELPKGENKITSNISITYEIK